MPVSIMPPEGRKALQNRFFVAKNRAKKDGIPFHWESFKDWWEDFEEIMPDDFDWKTTQVKYDLYRAREYSPRTMGLVKGSKMKMRLTEQAAKMTEVSLAEQQRRGILAAELSMRLLSYTPGTSFQEILKESLAAAGIPA